MYKPRHHTSIDAYHDITAIKVSYLSKLVFEFKMTDFQTWLKTIKLRQVSRLMLFLRSIFQKLAIVTL